MKALRGCLTPLIAVGVFFGLQHLFAYSDIFAVIASLGEGAYYLLSSNQDVLRFLQLSGRG